MLAGFVLIGFLGSLWSVILIAGLYALAALSALPGRGRWRALALLAAGGGAVYGVGLTLDAWRSPCNAESAYSCIRIEDRQALGAGPSRVLVIDHLVHGINVRDHPDHFVMGYIELVDLLARHRFDGVPERAFFVGGGAYTLPRAWLAAGGEAVVAELDPLVTTTAIERLWLEPAAGLVIHHQDARVALAAQQGDARPFDLIFGDAFQDVTVPPHLVTVEFAELVRDRLHPDGFYVINVIDHALEPRFAAAVARTLAAVFPEVAIWRERADLARSGRVNHVITASERPLDLSAAEGAPPYNRQWHPIRLDLDAPILTDDHSPVERLLAAGR
ncbi:MAG: hypothetical protein EA356_14755 [Geminicoccaceae bacterium]|nr:MAG: hypothetical protein EA356_14755 [Geminicoccaceae bacterium]